ncbi:hypothetical protein G5C51_01255 [Streptomyces sp. A7024]|uniref:Phytanoyl-CoA dioxygenase n=1 Tax=Streptomyces coryli TaxID=1128680 RepID=A0A6G4TSL6_9ACTN|nr:phytanoyl-CoA dioxygenase family protein [Streptomyces coryli]NGN62540.1 hypothetical protein [Streptomyces coryli]
METNAPETGAPALTRDEVGRFHRSGYLGPYAACTPAEMAELRERIDLEVLPAPGPNPGNPLQARHLDRHLVHDLATRPAVLGRLRGLLGDDIVLWTTYFFNKEPGALELPWHQDVNFWPIEPPLNVSIWMAVDHVTTENSCVQLIPGSHRTVIPHLPSRPGMSFAEEADPALVEADKAVDMELAPGEFFIFNERMLHRSAPNHSTRRRLGFSARYTLPQVSILDQDSAPLFPGHACVLVSGSDAMGLNRMTEPPAR